MKRLNMDFEIVTTGREFEEMLYRRMTAAGYACELTPETGDQGVDIIVALNGHKVAIQCKLYSGPVGNDAVQEVFAGRMFYGCDISAVVTNAEFTGAARRLSASTGVALLHYTQLGSYLESIGCADIDAFSIEMLVGSERIEELTSNDDSVAVTKLACRYLLGHGVTRSKEEGWRLLQKALLDGTPDAVFAVSVADDCLGGLPASKGELGNNTISVQSQLARDGLRAARAYIYEKAKTGCTEYFQALSELYWSCRDYEKAIEWASNAFTKGVHSAARLLGDIYSDEGFSCCSMEEAISWYRKGSDLGDVPSMMRLAELSIRKVAFDESLCYLRQASKSVPKDVVALVQKELLPNQSLSDDCRIAALQLLSECMFAAGIHVVEGEELKEMLNLARRGHDAAIATLRRTMEERDCADLVEDILPEANSGQTWARQLVGAYYKGKARNCSGNMPCAGYLMNAIEYGCQSVIPELVKLAGMSLAVKNYILSKVVRSKDLRRAFENNGIDVGNLM